MDEGGGVEIKVGIRRGNSTYLKIFADGNAVKEREKEARKEGRRKEGGEGEEGEEGEEGREGEEGGKEGKDYLR
jgi:hypothetical protein